VNKTSSYQKKQQYKSSYHKQAWYKHKWQRSPLPYSMFTLLLIFTFLGHLNHNQNSEVPLSTMESSSLLDLKKNGTEPSQELHHHNTLIDHDISNH